MVEPAMLAEKDKLPRIPAGPRLRLLMAMAAGLAVSLIAPRDYSPAIRALGGWNLAVLTFILLLLRMMARSTPEVMRRRAAIQDSGRAFILAAIVAAAMFSTLALVFIQRAEKAAVGSQSALYIGIIATTIFLSWFLVHIIFTVHYAHEYYGPASDADDKDGLVGGLGFPSEHQPDYWDFMYFSFVIGMTCQVSDVAIEERSIRRLALMHGIVSFFFNTIILALTINVLGSAI